MEIVNGYVCQTCCDVELAKRGVDPAHPKDDPKNPNYDPAKAKADEHGPAFKLGGSLQAKNAPKNAHDLNGVVGSSSNALPPVNGVQAPDGTSQTPQSTQPGAVLNIAA